MGRPDCIHCANMHAYGADEPQLRAALPPPSSPSRPRMKIRTSAQHTALPQACVDFAGPFAISAHPSRLFRPASQASTIQMEELLARATLEEVRPPMSTPTDVGIPAANAAPIDPALHTPRSPTATTVRPRAGPRHQEERGRAAQARAKTALYYCNTVHLLRPALHAIDRE